jgi:hypothetical protein
MENFKNLVDATGLLQDIRDGKLEGREALEKLAETKQFVFHGSPDNIAILEPRQAINDDQPHGKPGVSAAPDESFELAIFMALVGSRKNQPSRPHGIRYTGFSVSDGVDGRGDLHANRLAYEDATSPGAFGYVHVLTKKDFEHFEDREWRAYKPVSPVLAVRVTAKDFPKNVTITD